MTRILKLFLKCLNSSKEGNVDSDNNEDKTRKMLYECMLWNLFLSRETQYPNTVWLEKISSVWCWGDYTLLSPYLLNFNLMIDHTLLGTLCWHASCNWIIFFHSKIKGKWNRLMYQLQYDRSLMGLLAREGFNGCF